MLCVIDLFIEVVILTVEVICLPPVMMFYGMFKLLDWLCSL